MAVLHRHERAFSSALTLGVVLLFGFATLAQAAENLPNLTPFPAKDIRIVVGTDGRSYLRFSTVSWNKGWGPLELIADVVDTANGKQKVFQRIYSSDGTFQDVLAGWFLWDGAHSHFHFDDYALYTLQLASAPGASDRTSAKTTFCVMDTTRVDMKLPGASKRAIYRTCNATKQGMSVGWGDQYGYQLAGQAIDITGLLNGDYNLKIEIDPKDRLVELDRSDNISNVLLRLNNGTVTLIN